MMKLTWYHVDADHLMAWLFSAQKEEHMLISDARIKVHDKLSVHC